MARSTVSPVGVSLTLAALVIGAACGGSATAVPSAPVLPSASVTISGQTAALAPNMTVQLTATLKNPDGSTADCTPTATWSSSNNLLIKPTGSKPGEFLIVDSGDASAGAVCSGTMGSLAIHIDKPTSWPVSGRVVAGPEGPGISGATLAFGSLAPVTSGSNGAYTIVTPDATTQRLVVSAAGYYTRETSLRGGTLRSLDIDLIGANMPLWLAMAHNGGEAPQSVDLVPTQRWTENPNVYIWTTWKDTGAPVANVDWLVREIRRVIPQLSGFTLQAGLIETGPEERPLTPGWIRVQFHHSGNYAYLGKNPGEVQFGGDSACNYIAITHEFGHAMGYWHTRTPNTIMGTTPGYCHEADLTPDELKVAKAMYARSPFNYTPDRDSSSSFALSQHLRDGVKILCDLVSK